MQRGTTSPKQRKKEEDCACVLDAETEISEITTARCWVIFFFQHVAAFIEIVCSPLKNIFSHFPLLTTQVDLVFFLCSGFEFLPLELKGALSSVRKYFQRKPFTERSVVFLELQGHRVWKGILVLNFAVAVKITNKKRPTHPLNWGGRQKSQRRLSETLENKKDF